jgi:hypothetical protein
MKKKVNYVLDADIHGFFDNLDKSWLIKFVEHRVANPRILRLIRKWLNAGVMAMVGNEDRYSARLGGISDPRQYLSPLCFRSLGGRLAQEVCARRGGSNSLCGRYHPRFPTSG